MPRSTNHAVRARAACALAAYLRRPAVRLSAVKKAIASLFAVGILIGATGRGQIRESLANETNPPQAPAHASSSAPSPAQDGESETATLRAETLERLKALGAGTISDPASDASSSAATKAEGAASAAPLSSISTDHLAHKSHQKLLQERLNWLDEHARLTLALKKTTSPESSPERQSDQLKAEFKQLQAMLTQAGKSPETLLPPSFLKNSGAPAVLAAEMKDAIDATTHELG